ncbi:MAG TPA: hypothetical protein VIV60_19120 [Polyangiaceae bacterium]
MTQAPNLPYVMVTPKGSARIVATDGQNVTLHADFVSPPGSPLRGMLADSDHPLQVKVHGCRRITGDSEPTTTGSAAAESLRVREAAAAHPPAPSRSEQGNNLFEITGRWVSLSRDARNILLSQAT